MTILLSLVTIVCILGSSLARKAPRTVKLKVSENNVADLKTVFRATLSSVMVSSVLLGSRNVIDISFLPNLFAVPSAIAAVGEGGLPDGIVAFQKLVKYQKDLDSVAESAKKERRRDG